MRALLALVVILLGLLICASARAERVSACLVLAVDVSSSIDTQHWKLQRDGYADAFEHPAVLRAISASEHSRIAVMVFEWSGRDEQRTLVPWTIVETPADGTRVAAVLRTQPRPFEGVTAVGAALERALTEAMICPFETDVRIIDISGDGENNDGPAPFPVRERIAQAGIALNALAIDWPRAHPPPGMTIEEYYRSIVGSGGFVMVADGFDTFAYALHRKLVREVAGR